MTPSILNPTTRSRRMCRTAQVAALAGCVGALFSSAPATAQDFTVHAEGAAAFWLDKPQSTRFTPGGYMAIRPGVTLGRVVSFQLSYALLGTPAKDPFTETGIAHFASGGIRLRPFATIQPDTEHLGGFWIDANAGYVRTGELNRFGVDVGLGYGFQATRWLAVGPVVRYGHILQPDLIEGRDPNDGQFLIAGVNFSFGAAPKPMDEAECPDTPECPDAPDCPVAPECPEPVAVVAVPTACPDSDRDGVCNDVDRCPTLKGTVAMFGCPVDPCTGEPLVVLVQFPYDSATMPVPLARDPQTMDPVLDAVAAAIAQNPTCRVCIVGHASVEGTDAYNQTLSVERAKAVQRYMTARGVAAARIPTTGLGETCQLVPEAGYSLNRRVDFYRLDEGEACPTRCEP